MSTHVPFFPLARYFSIVGVHTTLLLFVALFLPRSTFLFELTRPAVDEAKLTSRDRPQDPFLAALTTSPIMTVVSICLGVAVLQNWWAGWVRTWSIDYKFGAADDTVRLEKGKLFAGRLSALANAWLATLVASIGYSCILLLFGAPLSSHFAETYSLAVLLSLLTILTPAYTLGVPSLASDSQSLLTRFTWVKLFGEFSIHTPVDRALVYPAIGTIIGSWLGCIPIALDWDRPWQSWPLTPAFGGVFGFVASSLSALTITAINSLAEEHLKSQ